MRLYGTEPAKIHLQHKAAQNKVTWAFNRAKGGVESVRALATAGSPEVEKTITTLVASLVPVRDAAQKRLDMVYRDRCAALGVKPAAVALTDKEREYSQMIPRRRFKVYSAEAQKLSQAPRPAPEPPAAAGAPARPRLTGFASTAVNYFIDGNRSILDIYNAVRAECGNLQVGSSKSKFAYVLGLEYPDVELEAVVAAIQNLEKTGVVEVVKAAQKPKAGKTP